MKKQDLKEEAIKWLLYRTEIEKFNIEIEDIDFIMFESRFKELVYCKMGERNAYIVSHLFGLGVEKHTTLQIADALGVSRTTVDTNYVKAMRQIFFSKDVVEYLIGISNEFPKSYDYKSCAGYNLGDIIFYGDIEKSNLNNKVIYNNVRFQSIGYAFKEGNKIIYQNVFLKKDVENLQEKIKEAICNGGQTVNDFKYIQNLNQKLTSYQRQIEKKKESIKKAEEKIALLQQDIKDLEKQKKKVEKELTKNGNY